MTEVFTLTGDGVEVSELIGYEWCKPRSYWETSRDGVTRVPYPGTVSVKTNEGVLLLCRVEKITRGCYVGFRRTPIKPEELNYADI